MKKFCVLATSLVLCCSPTIRAQKLKYKDIFPLIQSSNWDEAEVKLEAFLADPKNADEANAHYSLGRILERKAQLANIVTDTVKLVAEVDAATIHFNKSLSLINEKELKKNEGYYQEFNRRDLRTGEFGIKVSDVHLDIENKIKALQDRRDNVRLFLKEAAVAKKLYGQAADLVQGFKIDFTNQSSFLLALDKEVEQRFLKVEGIANELESAVSKSESALAKIPSSGLAHSVSKEMLRDLANFKKEPLELTSSGSIKYWDLKSWVDMTKTELKSNMAPLRQQMIAYDRDLVAKKQAFNQDQASVVVPAEVDPLLLAKIKEFGHNTLTERVISFKVEELNFIRDSQRSNLPDSAKVDELYVAVSSLVNRLQKMQGLIEINKQKAEEGFRNNPVFFESRYVSSEQLLGYVNERKSFVDLQMKQLSAKEMELKNRRTWLTSDKGDSIALAISDSIANPIAFRAIHVADSAGLYVTGLQLVGKELNFNIVKASPAYTVEWMVSEKLPQPDKDFVFRPKNANHAPTADGFRTFYIYYPVKGKTHFYIMTVDVAGKPLWKASMDIDHPPVNISFNKMVMETVIYLEKPEGDPTNDLSYIVVDRNGKVRK